MMRGALDALSTKLTATTALAQADPASGSKIRRLMGVDTAELSRLHGYLIKDRTLKTDLTFARLAVVNAVYHRRASLAASGFGS